MRFKNMKNVLKMSVFVSAAILTGCPKYIVRYDDITLDLKYSGSKVVGVAVHDQRTYIKSGEKKPFYAGVVRGGFGNPFDVQTEDGKPLADDFLKSICDSLTQKGFKTMPVALKPGDAFEEARKKLLAADAERFILVIINEWYSDSYFGVGIFYDITLRVLDRRGGGLAEVTIKGKDDLGTEWFGSTTYSESPNTFKEKFEHLLNDDKVETALK